MSLSIFLSCTFELGNKGVDVPIGHEGLIRVQEPEYAM